MWAVSQGRPIAAGIFQPSPDRRWQIRRSGDDTRQDARPEGHPGVLVMNGTMRGHAPCFHCFAAWRLVWDALSTCAPHCPPRPSKIRSSSPRSGSPFVAAVVDLAGEMLGAGDDALGDPRCPVPQRTEAGHRGLQLGIIYTHQCHYRNGRLLFCYIVIT